MTINCIGCGSSAKHWDGSGYSVGVNDASKWGFPLSELILVNRPSKFAPERLDTIMKGTYWTIYSHKPGDWIPNFKNVEHLPLSPFSGRVKRGIVYKSATSPFIAISKAFAMGATEIVIWGVDFTNHGTFKPGSSSLKNELNNYRKLIEGIEGQHGVKVWLGAEGSALEQFVEVKR